DLQLYRAAVRGNIESMRSAISNGADINWKSPIDGNFTPLHAAAIENKINAVQWLLSNGATVDSRAYFR
uniref:Uncharacterized protein n=1 Tax=Amphimedon queenslandica TaxID=400682 RepID=A0A1X7SR54_AMPQE